VASDDDDGDGGTHDGGTHDGDRDADDFLGTVSMAVRARRRAQRLDQRELAARAGVSKSTVGRVERGDGGIGLSLLRAVLAEVGLDIALVDEDGYPWRDGDALPADVEGAVDRAGRRLPAHLPATFTDSLTSWDFARAHRPLLQEPARWRYNRYSDDVAALVKDVTTRGTD
jgi:transcriptional regulator with XRE-family HTH domain